MSAGILVGLMLTKLLKAKIHRARVTETQIDYHGSIRIDTDLLRASGIVPNEAVLVVDCDNGNRFETYVIPGEAGSGVIGVYGAAARLTAAGHVVIIMSFIHAEKKEIALHASNVLILNDDNHVAEKITQPSTI